MKYHNIKNGGKMEKQNRKSNGEGSYYMRYDKNREAMVMEIQDEQGMFPLYIKLSGSTLPWKIVKSKKGRIFVNK